MIQTDHGEPTSTKTVGKIDPAEPWLIRVKPTDLDRSRDPNHHRRSAGAADDCETEWHRRLLQAAHCVKGNTSQVRSLAFGRTRSLGHGDEKPGTGLAGLSDDGLGDDGIGLSTVLHSVRNADADDFLTIGCDHDQRCE